MVFININYYNHYYKNREFSMDIIYGIVDIITYPFVSVFTFLWDLICTILIYCYELLFVIGIGIALWFFKVCINEFKKQSEANKYQES